jgi:hypothetical protein
MKISSKIITSQFCSEALKPRREKKALSGGPAGLSREERRGACFVSAALSS